MLTTGIGVCNDVKKTPTIPGNRSQLDLNNEQIPILVDTAHIYRVWQPTEIFLSKARYLSLTLGRFFKCRPITVVRLLWGWRVQTQTSTLRYYTNGCKIYYEVVLIILYYFWNVENVPTNKSQSLTFMKSETQHRHNGEVHNIFMDSNPNLDWTWYFCQGPFSFHRKTKYNKMFTCW